MTEPWITEPGIYDIPAEQYHQDPVVEGSLSHSGAKKLLPPSCPAIFKAWREGGSEHKDVFDFGRAAHRRVLGAGDEIVVLDFDDWKKAAAQTAKKEAYAAGLTPILTKDDEVIEAMAVALREHPIAASLLDPASGAAEQTLVWRDRDSGVMCRALVDFLRTPIPDRRLIMPDYKTANEVDPESIAKAIASYAYHGQGAWYGDGAEQLNLTVVSPAFVLIFQRKTAPHLVVCVQVTPDDINRGYERNRAARHLYRWCTDHDRWPSYRDGHGHYADEQVLSLQIPSWEQMRHDGASERGDFEPHRQGVPA